MIVDKIDWPKEAKESGMTDEQNNTQSSASGNAENEDKTSRMDAAKAFFRSMYAGADGDEDSSSDNSSDNRRVQELEQALKDAEQKTVEAEGLYKRMAADFDNFRRRVERERDEYASHGVRKAAESILPALDDLDRALSYLKPDTPAAKLIESFELVSSRLFSCLEQVGLKRIDTRAVLFDPYFHEPVQQIETTEHPDGTVVNELRAGYALGEKVIRPALVNVASNNTPEPVIEAEPIQEAIAPVEGSSVEEALVEGPPEKHSEGKKAKGKPKPEPSDDRVYDLGDIEDIDE